MFVAVCSILCCLALSAEVRVVSAGSYRRQAGLSLTTDFAGDYLGEQAHGHGGSV